MTDNRNPDDSNVERLSRLTSARQTDDEVVREYEERYTPRKAKRELPRSYRTVSLTDEEKRWSAIAHASAWLTLLGGILSFGTIVPITIFIPLAIFLHFRKQSDYVAFHALQAFVLQLVGTVGAFALLIIGAIVWGLGMVIAGLLVVLLVGVILVPVWLIVGIVLGGAILLMPLAMLLYSTIAAIETANGHDYRYPVIARWIDRQLADGLLNVA